MARTPRCTQRLQSTSLAVNHILIRFRIRDQAVILCAEDEAKFSQLEEAIGTFSGPIAKTHPLDQEATLDRKACAKLMEDVIRRRKKKQSLQQASDTPGTTSGGPTLGATTDTGISGAGHHGHNGIPDFQTQPRMTESVEGTSSECIPSEQSQLHSPLAQRPNLKQGGGKQTPSRVTLPSNSPDDPSESRANAITHKAPEPKDDADDWEEMQEMPLSPRPAVPTSKPPASHNPEDPTNNESSRSPLVETSVAGRAAEAPLASSIRQQVISNMPKSTSPPHESATATLGLPNSGVIASQRTPASTPQRPQAAERPYVYVPPRLKLEQSNPDISLLIAANGMGRMVRALS